MRSLLVSFLFLITLIKCPVVHAENDYKEFPVAYTNKVIDGFNPYIGLLMNLNNSENFGLVGVDIGYQIYYPYFLAIEISHVKENILVNGGYKRTNALVKVLYTLGESIESLKYTYIGFGVGPSFYDSTSNLISTTIIGFDVPLTDTKREFFSLGVDVKYVFYNGISNVDNLLVNVFLKYWL